MIEASVYDTAEGTTGDPRLDKHHDHLTISLHDIYGLSVNQPSHSFGYFLIVRQ